VPPVSDFNSAEVAVLWSNPTIRVRVISGSDQVIDPG